MASVAERLEAARVRLEAAGLTRSEATLDAEVLARHALTWDRAALITHRRDLEPAGFDHAFEALIARRAARVPVAQLTGVREFWGRDFSVTSDVLIPRPETELIVEEALAFAAEAPYRRAIDVGTGSGCLAVTLAAEIPAATVTAVDISEEALVVARQNAARHGVAERVTFIQGDLFRNLSGVADLIVSNPPYIPESHAAHLQAEIVAHEPHAALFGGPTGLEVISRLLEAAPAHVAPGGRLILEFGVDQSAAITQLAHDSGWLVVRVRPDLQGIPRTIVLSRR